MEEAHISTTLALPRLRKFGLHPFAAYALRRQYKQHFLVYSLRLINLLVQLLPARWPVPLQLAAAKSQSAPAYISSSAYQLPSRVNPLSLPLVQKPPVRSMATGVSAYADSSHTDASFRHLDSCNSV